MTGNTIAHKNEIDAFIHKYFADDLITVAGEWFAKYNNKSKLSTHIKEPDTVEMTSAEYKYADNITTLGDNLNFTAAMLCNIQISKFDEQQENNTITIKQWLFLNCQVTINDPTMTFLVSSGVLSGGHKNKLIGYAVDNNLVPYISKDSLEAEATRFLKEYCPEALVTPMPVPIMEIINEKMKLGVRLGGILTEKHGVFGQICFSDMEVKQVCFKTGNQIERAAPRGTIVVDIRTFERSEGCVNNTLAHEAFHWYRHRVYGTIREMLHGDKFIACRRKTNINKKNGKSTATIKWTDEARIEWQANSIAPRILMPAVTFRKKVDELLEQHDFNSIFNETEREQTLKSVIVELSKFYQVSKQSAKIRMIDLGYSDAATVFNYDEYNNNRIDMFSEISQKDAFNEYRKNLDFRRVLDSGKFRYVENHFVIDHDKYTIADGFGSYKLTNYARKNLDECVLRFCKYKEYPYLDIEKPAGVAFRMDSKSAKSGSHYIDNANESIIDNAEALHKLRETFDIDYETHIAITPSFSQTATSIMKRKKWNSTIFREMTHLDDSIYSRIINNSSRAISLRTAVAICVGLGVDALTANSMLSSVGLSFGQSKEHRAYSYLFSALHGKSIDECNAFLESISVTPLGIRDKDI